MMALVEAAGAPDCPFEIVLVAADRPDAAGLAWARSRGLNAVGFDTPTRSEKPRYEALLGAALRDAKTEVIALAGYMRLLSDHFVAAWRGRILNIHPSLLPAYKGLDPHGRAIAAGEPIAGCSVHVVNEQVDGGKVLGRSEVPILPGDTAAQLAERVLVEEHELYPRILAAFVTQ